MVFISKKILFKGTDIGFLVFTLMGENGKAGFSIKVVLFFYVSHFVGLIGIIGGWKINFHNEFGGWTFSQKEDHPKNKYPPLGKWEQSRSTGGDHPEDIDYSDIYLDTEV